MKPRPGYLVVIDGDGAEVPRSRRDVSHLSHEQAVAVRRELEAAMGPFCYVEFRPKIVIGVPMRTAETSSSA